MRVLLALHPITGFATIALTVWTASLGLRARGTRRAAAAARRRHARVAPWAYGGLFATWLAGLASVYWLAPDMELAASGHFQVGTVIVALASATALLSRWVPTDERARVLHPWLGAMALVLCGVQIFLGLQILR